MKLRLALVGLVGAFTLGSSASAQVLPVAEPLPPAVANWAVELGLQRTGNSLYVRARCAGVGAPVDRWGTKAYRVFRCEVKRRPGGNSIVVARLAFGGGVHLSVTPNR